MQIICRRKSPDNSLTESVSDMDALIAGDWSSDVAVVSEILEYMSSREVLESTEDNLKCKYQGCLIACELEPRNVEYLTQSPRKRKSDSDTNKAVDCVFVDRAGPVTVTLWGDTAEQVCGIWRRAVETCPEGQSPRCLLEFSKLRIHDFPKNDWNGSFLTKMRQLSSLEAVGTDPGTEVSLVHLVNAANMISTPFTVPSPEYCISNFQSLRSKLRAPFRVTLKGVVVDLLPLDHSQAGNKKRHFNIVDKQGTYFNCCAMKHNIGNPALQNYREIVIFCSRTWTDLFKPRNGVPHEGCSDSPDSFRDAPCDSKKSASSNSRCVVVLRVCEADVSPTLWRFFHASK